MWWNAGLWEIARAEDGSDWMAALWIGPNVRYLFPGMWFIRGRAWVPAFTHQSRVVEAPTVTEPAAGCSHCWDHMDGSHS